MADDSLYKREEDHKWRERTDERLTLLTQGEIVQNDRLDEHDKLFVDMEILLEGDPKDKNDNGLKGDIHDLSVQLNALQRIMAPDNFGNGGILNRLKAVERQAGLEEKSVEGRWKFWSVVAVAIISSLTAILTNIDKFEKFANSFGKPEAHHNRTPNKKTKAKRDQKQIDNLDHEIDESNPSKNY